MVKTDRLIQLDGRHIQIQGFFYYHARTISERHLHFRISEIEDIKDKQGNVVRKGQSLPLKKGQPFVVNPTETGLNEYSLIDSKGFLGVKKRVIGKIRKTNIQGCWLFKPK